MKNMAYAVDSRPCIQTRGIFTDPGDLFCCVSAPLGTLPVPFTIVYKYLIPARTRFVVRTFTAPSPFSFSLNLALFLLFWRLELASDMSERQHALSNILFSAFLALSGYGALSSLPAPYRLSSSAFEMMLPP